MITPKNAPVGSYVIGSASCNVYRVVEWCQDGTVVGTLTELKDATKTNYKVGQTGNVNKELFVPYPTQDKDNEI